MNETKILSDNLNIVKRESESINGNPVLCTLEGIVADFKNPTRNGRFYSKKLWEKAMQSPNIQEQIANGGIMLELNHPEDRDETDLSCVAAIMPELPKEREDGKLVARVHVINTPMGQIANTLARYGYKLGISSRGNGDVDYKGAVIEDTYQLQCWDLVAMPAVQDARLSLVTESLNRPTLKESLQKIVDQSNEKDKKAIVEKLALLNIEITPDSTEDDETDKNVNAVVVDVTSDGENISISKPQDEEINLDEIQTEVTVTPEIVDDIVSNVESSESDELIQVNQEELPNAVDDGSDILKDLHEALSQIEQLNKQNDELRSSISVGHSKEQELTEKLNAYKQKIAELIEATKQIKGLTARSQKIEENKNAIEENLNKATAKNESLNRIVTLQKTNINQLRNFNERSNKKLESCKDLLNKSEAHCKQLTEEYSTKLNELVERFDLLEKSSQTDLQNLKEHYEEQIQSIQEENKHLVEKTNDYKNQLVKMTEAYVNSSCDIYDLDTKQVLSKIKNFSKEEVDRITESLTNRKLSNRLNIKIPSVKRISYSGNRENILYRPQTNNSDDIDISEINNYER